jgi:dTDP-4-dehydrorhamnose reductase
MWFRRIRVDRRGGLAQELVVAFEHFGLVLDFSRLLVHLASNSIAEVKGVVLAGGTGSRLDPLTRVTNKHLLPIGDRPMVQWSVDFLRDAGVRDLLLVTGADHVDDFRGYFGDELDFAIQQEAGGIAEALGLARDFAAGDRIVVMLADNFFSGPISDTVHNFEAQDRGARVLLAPVRELEHLRHLGVPRIEEGRITEIVEKPQDPPSGLAVTGVYCYDADVFEVVERLEPSARGELEITDVNNHYVREGTLEFDVFEGYWGDAGESVDAYYEVIERVRRPHFGSDRLRPVPLRRFVQRGDRRRQLRRRLRSGQSRARVRSPDRRADAVPRERGVRRERSRRERVAVGRPARRRSLEHPITDPVRTGRARVLITGAGGQLGRALQDTFVGDGVLALGHEDWDVTLPAPAGLEADLVLHAAAWTDVDGAEADPQGAAAANVGGTHHAAELGAPLVYYSTDYVFDGTQREPYLESDAPNPLSAYGRTKLHGEAAAGERAWIVRTSGLFGVTGTNFVRTMLRLGHERDEVAVVHDQRTAPTYVNHLAAATKELLDRPFGIWHLAAAGDCTWAEFTEAIFEEAGLDTRVRRISTDELARPAPRPAFSVLRSEKDAPALPHWREGLRACLSRIA